MARPALRHPPRLAGRQLHLAPVLLATLLVWVAATIGVAALVGLQLRAAVLDRTAVVTGLYVETLFEPQLQSLALAHRIDASAVSGIEREMSGTPLAASVVALKVWSPQGEIVYSPATSLVGQRFPVAGDLASAVQGTTATDISDLHAGENIDERARWSSLVETYVPIRDRRNGRVIGVAELYQRPDEIAAEIAVAERGSWPGIAVAGLLSYLLVAGLMIRPPRAGNPAASPINGMVGPWPMLASRDRWSATREPATAPGPGPSRAAAMHLIERASAERREIDEALFNGPGQQVAAALIGVEAIRAGLAPDDQRRASEELALVDAALRGALREIREIGIGLRMPDVAGLALADVVERAVRAPRRAAGATVQTIVGDLPADAAPALKIALFQAVQAAVAFLTLDRGASEISVIAGSDGQVLNLRVAGTPGGLDGDPGLQSETPGADAGGRAGSEPIGGRDGLRSSPADPADATPLSLDLALVREHAILLGGTLAVFGPSQGSVVVTAAWPLAEDTAGLGADRIEPARGTS